MELVDTDEENSAFKPSAAVTTRIATERTTVIPVTKSSAKKKGASPSAKKKPAKASRRK